MRIVLDTNVLISGIFFAGPPGSILDAWSANRVQIVTSPEILEEYRRVASELGRKYKQAQPQPILDILTATCEICLVTPLEEQVMHNVRRTKQAGEYEW